MVGILVTGHGHFATGLGSSLKLITGITENVALVDFEADHSTDTLTENINKAMKRRTRVPKDSPVKLVAVTKNHDINAMREAIDAGVTDIGELHLN